MAYYNRYIYFGNINNKYRTHMDSDLLSFYINNDSSIIDHADEYDGSIIDTFLTKYVDTHLENHIAKYNIDYIENSKYYNENSKIIIYVNEIFEKRKYPLFKKYIEKGVPLNVPIIRQKNLYHIKTYLESAISQGEYDLALWLIKRGADITFSCGYNAIIWLPKMQCKTILSYIVDINMKNCQGSTLLHIAVIHGNNYPIRYLLKQRKANPFILNMYDVSPFSMVVNYTYNDKILYTFIKYSIGLSRKINVDNNNNHDVWLRPMACNSIYNYKDIDQNQTDKYILSCDIMTRIVHYTKSDISQIFSDYSKKIDHIIHTLPQPIAEELVLFINMLD